MGRHLQSAGEYVKNLFSATESFLLQLREAGSAVRDVLRIGFRQNKSVNQENDVQGAKSQNASDHSHTKTSKWNFTPGIQGSLCCSLPLCSPGLPECKCVGGAAESHHCAFYNLNITSCSTSGAGCCFCKYLRSQYVLHVFIFALPFLLVFYLFWMYYDDYLSKFLTSFEQMNPEMAVALFMALFIVASFPLVWGYVILNLAAGYRFGVVNGVFVVMVSVTIGLTFSHKISQRLCLGCISRALKCYNRTDHIEAILKVLEGPSGLKVIALTRLTPIPFGLQNGIFAMSNIKTRHYVAASNVGLLPTQVLNCYMGSTFRSAEDIMNQGGSIGGYILFFIQVAIGFTLMVYVIRHAKKELAKALNSPVENVERANLIEEAPDENALTEVRVTQPQSQVPM